MKMDEIIREIAKRGHNIWLDQWHDEWGHWRAALDYTADSYLFICEKPTLEEVLQSCLNFLDGK